MEIILAIVVASAVIFFGALISIGNERQRKAIDYLSDQISSWAIKDIQLKRSNISCNVKIDDPVKWLIKVIGNASDKELNLEIIEFLDNPQALVCADKDTGRSIVFSPVSPRDVYHYKHKQKSKLARTGISHPLLRLPHQLHIKELTVLENGILFDLEFHFVWKKLTGKDIDQINKCWVYFL